MEDTPTNSQPEQKVENKEVSQPKAKKKLPIGAVLKTILVIAILAGLGVAGYYGNKARLAYQSDIKDLKSKIGLTNDRVAAVEITNTYNAKTIEGIVNTQNTAQTTYNYPAPVYADLTVEKVLEDKNAALESGFKFVLVDIKLENKTNQDVYFSPIEFKLKDGDNYEFGIYDANPYTRDYIKKDAKILLPDNRLPMGYAALKSGETDRGTVVFVINRPSSKFTLYRNGVALKDISL